MKLWKKLSFFLLIFSLPTQLGKHFWLNESLVLGRKIDYLSPTVYLTDILFIFWLIIIIQNPAVRKRIFLNKMWLFFSAFLLVILIISPVKLISVYFLLRIIEWWIFYQTLKFSKLGLEDVLWPLGFGAITSVFLALNQFYLQKSLQGIWYYFGETKFSLPTPGIAKLIVFGKIYLRPDAFFPHPNVFGGFLAVLLPLFLFWTDNPSKVRYMFKRLIFGLSLIGVVVSFSRTAWTGTLIMMTAVFFIKKKTKPLKAVFFLAAVFLLEEIFLGRFINLFSVDQNTWAERQKLILASWQMMQNHPVFGVGLGGFFINLPKYMAPPFLLQPVHSLYLMMISETGAVGLFLFIFNIKKFLQKTIKNHQTGLFLSLCLVLFLGIFDHYFYTIKQTQWLLVLILGIISVKQTGLGVK